MSAPYSAKAVANYFLELAKSKGRTLDQMKLQKIIYFAHGWYLAIYDRPLIDEHVQAWKYGPVIPSVYHEFKRFGSGPITGSATDLDRDGLYVPFVPKDDKETVALLDRIWEVYGRFNGIQLSNVTHDQGTPWDTVWKQGEGMPELAIPNDVIKDFFVNKPKNAAKAG